jgi:hypothetical protein
MMNQPPFVAQQYVSARGRGLVAKVLLIAVALVTFVFAVLTALAMAFPPIGDDTVSLEGQSGEYVAAYLLTVASGLVALLLLALYAATAVAFCMWLYRSAKNVKAFGTPPNQIEYSPGWAVGSFFVPFVFLVVPFRAIKEVWRNSRPATASFLAVDPPALFTIWWVFWLLSNFAYNAYFRLSEKGLLGREATQALVIGADLLAVVAAILAILVVGELDRRQEEASQSMGLGTFGGSPIPPAPPTFG